MNKGKRYSPIRSRLVSDKGVLKIPKSGTNRQGRVPWSNMAFNPPPHIPNPEEFRLNDFAFAVPPRTTRER